METDREFLMWLHERLEKKFGEHHLVGHMHRLRAIIKGTPAGQTTRSGACNSLDELKKELEAEQMKGFKRYG